MARTSPATATPWCAAPPTPAQRAQTRLIIQNGYTASLENAYYDFMAARGDVEATLTDFGGDLVQSLLGKSQEVDIYCADAQLPAYEAALSRGLPARH